MKVKTGLILSSLVLALLLTGICMPVSASAETITLTYANFPPAPTFPCVQMERWKTEVEKRTNGKVVVKTFPGGTLLGDTEMMDGVIAGQANIGNLCMAYQPGRFIVTNATSLHSGYPMRGSEVLYCWIFMKNTNLKNLPRSRF